MLWRVMNASLCVFTGTVDKLRAHIVCDVGQIVFW